MRAIGHCAQGSALPAVYRVQLAGPYIIFGHHQNFPTGILANPCLVLLTSFCRTQHVRLGRVLVGRSLRLLSAFATLVRLERYRGLGDRPNKPTKRQLVVWCKTRPNDARSTALDNRRRSDSFCDSFHLDRRPQNAADHGVDRSHQLHLQHTWF